MIHSFSKIFRNKCQKTRWKVHIVESEFLSQHVRIFFFKKNGRRISDDCLQIFLFFFSKRKTNKKKNVCFTHLAVILWVIFFFVETENLGRLNKYDRNSYTFKYVYNTFNWIRLYSKKKMHFSFYMRLHAISKISASQFIAIEIFELKGWKWKLYMQQCRRNWLQ